MTRCRSSSCRQLSSTVRQPGDHRWTFEQGLPSLYFPQVSRGPRWAEGEGAVEGAWEAGEATMRWGDSGGAMYLGEIPPPPQLKGHEGGTERGWLFVQPGSGPADGYDRPEKHGAAR